ncbi:hypothetical protein [Sinorhizobium alkalisoli]|uniref:Uncharacterized protein n=1 Tax=Sinorhizobium alkalisoli TaxID=1752398 RepID=A0A1E3V697_9HYPH|nr:hypothetical protein [Sinorhizobium alkalisoli]ODR88366.1 hypothetical protein A8M32_25490 [Sinorhizobium alkalisoli]
MRKTVFVDMIPDLSEVMAPTHEKYRSKRNLALAEMVTQDGSSWTERSCPACRSATPVRRFSQAIIPFGKCASCGTIFARKLPSQAMLDGRRLADQPDHDKDEEVGAHAARSIQFTSLTNWMRLTAARHSRTIGKVLDYRFSTNAAGWPFAARASGVANKWYFSSVRSPEDQGALEQLARELQEFLPDTVTIFSELDRFSDPSALLQLIKENTKSGAWIFIAAACADGLEYELLGADSPSFIPLDRLNLFSLSGLTDLAVDIGYDVIEVATPGRLDAVILQQYYNLLHDETTPFWPKFFRDADKDTLQNFQIFLQRSLRSGVLRLVMRHP